MISQMITNKMSRSPPNGGYGWIIVFAVAIIFAFDKSISYVFSLIFEQFFNDIKLSKKDVALVMNMTNSFLNFTGLFVGASIKAFTPRTLAVCSSLSISLGLIITSFTTTIYEIIFSYCLLVGIGLGFLTNICMVVVTSYFTTKKARAVSFSLVGHGIGKMFMPQIIAFLSIYYDYRGVILIVGAITLHAVVGSLMMHPVEWHMNKKDDEAMPLLMDSNNNSNYGIEMKKEEDIKKESFWQRITKQLDLDLLKDSRFVILNLGLACDYAAAMDFTLIFPFFLEVRINIRN